MATLTKQNIQVLQDAVKVGLISSSLANSIEDRSVAGNTGLRDLQFILTLMKELDKIKSFKKKHE